MKTYQIVKKETKDKVGPSFEEETGAMSYLEDTIAIDCWENYSLQVLTIEEFPIEIGEEDRIVYYPRTGN